MVDVIIRVRHFVYDSESREDNSIANHLVENGFEDYESLKFDFLDEDVMISSKDSEDEESDNKWRM